MAARVFVPFLAAVSVLAAIPLLSTCSAAAPATPVASAPPTAPQKPAPPKEDPAHPLANFGIAVEQETIMCAQFPTFYSCAAAEPARLNLGAPSVEAILAADLAAKEHWKYAEDPKDKDTWTPHVEDVLAGKDWTGDCEDIALTTLGLLYHEGYRRDTMGRLLLWSGDRKKQGLPIGYNHMFGLVRDDHGRIWVVGNTDTPPMLLDVAMNMPYHPVFIARSNSHTWVYVGPGA